RNLFAKAETGGDPEQARGEQEGSARFRRITSDGNVGATVEIVDAQGHGLAVVKYNEIQVIGARYKTKSDRNGETCVAAESVRNSAGYGVTIEVSRSNVVVPSELAGNGRAGRIEPGERKRQFERVGATGPGSGGEPIRIY